MFENDLAQRFPFAFLACLEELERDVPPCFSVGYHEDFRRRRDAAVEHAEYELLVVVFEVFLVDVYVFVVSVGFQAQHKGGVAEPHLVLLCFFRVRVIAPFCQVPPGGDVRASRRVGHACDDLFIGVDLEVALGCP